MNQYGVLEVIIIASALVLIVRGGVAAVRVSNGKKQLDLHYQAGNAGKSDNDKAA